MNTLAFEALGTEPTREPSRVPLLSWAGEEAAEMQAHRGALCQTSTR